MLGSEFTNDAVMISERRKKQIEVERQCFNSSLCKTCFYHSARFQNNWLGRKIVLNSGANSGCGDLKSCTFGCAVDSASRSRSSAPWQLVKACALHSYIIIAIT